MLRACNVQREAGHAAQRPAVLGIPHSKEPSNPNVSHAKIGKNLPENNLPHSEFTLQQGKQRPLTRAAAGCSPGDTWLHTAPLPHRGPS